MWKQFVIKFGLSGLASLVLGLVSVSAQEADYGKPADLPLPTTLPLQDYETKLFTWLMNQTYKELGWKGDKGVRDTGPYVLSNYYGTHLAVRIFYSPEVMEWLTNGRQGVIPDGAIIVKEMFTPPGVLYQELAKDPAYKDNPEAYEAMLGKLVTAWTVMVRDSQGSKDGWFWAQPGAPKENQSIADSVAEQLDNYSHELYSGFGGMCIRCHASAESELTFSALKNIEGFESEGRPLRFRVDTSWRSAGLLEKYPLSLLKDDSYAQSIFNLPKLLTPWTTGDAPEGWVYDEHLKSQGSTVTPAPRESLKEPNPEFINTFTSITPVPESEVKAFPPQWADHVVAAPHPEDFLTSDNCIGCHGGLGGKNSGSTMFIQTGPNYGDGINLSEFGEWRWSPMGLAGRDPIFHAQLESEMAYLERDGKEHPEQLVGSVTDNQMVVRNTCLSCHGAMGQRGLAQAAKDDPSLNPDFQVNYFYLTKALSSETPEPSNYKYHKYGTLAREGISCAICHRINSPDPQAVKDWTPKEGWITEATNKELAFMLFNNNTGHYNSGPADKLYGPFDDVAVKPMEHTLGMEPVYNEYTADSQMCGTCHTINLPNIGMTENPFPVLTDAQKNPALKNYSHTIEQATFLEWQNSVFAESGPQFESCQDCHMPNDYQSLNGDINIPQISTQIATIQDSDYPEADHLLPLEDIFVPLRPEYKRHEHVGLNAFLLEMFDQFEGILGVAKTDPMTYASNGVDVAIDNMIRQAQQDSIDLDVTIDAVRGQNLKATVTVTNKAGHRFPSGVAFRRAFLEFLVMEGDEVVWASGKTNSVGVILGSDGQPLASEFLPNADTYQPHYQTINSEDEVQIYEELNQNSDREFTTSFIHRVYPIKDNRLLPKGWRASSHFKDQGEVIYQFMQATDSHVTGDLDYEDQGPNFPGKDTLQYQVTLPRTVNLDQLSVKVTMYYQSIPPYWLHDRFSAVPEGDATKRLYYLTSHLNLDGTALEGWKLNMGSVTARFEQ